MSEEVTNGEMVVDVINEEGSVVPIKEQIEYFEPVGTNLTVVEEVIYQAEGEEAEGLDSRWSRIIQSKAEPDERRISVNDQWQCLRDFFDYHLQSTVVIKNRASLNLSVNPNPEEKEDLENKIILVCLSPSGIMCNTVPHMLIRPGAHFRLEVESIDQLYVKSFKSSDFIKSKVYVFPP